MQMPLMKPASSLARYSAALATSSAVDAKRPAEWWREIGARVLRRPGPWQTRPTGPCRVEDRVDAIDADVVGPQFRRHMDLLVVITRPL